MPRTVSSWSPWRRKPPPTLTLDLASASPTLGQREAVRAQPGRVDAHVDFLQVAAEGHDVGDARHLLQHARRRSTRSSARGLVEVVPVARHAELVDLAERRRLGRELRRHAVGQIGLRGDALRHLHARGERVGVVVEGERDERQAEQALAPELHHARRAVQRALERHRDAALDLLGRVARASARSPSPARW